MIENIMVVDLDACVRCYSCEIACRQENELPFESKSRWCRIITIEPRMIRGDLHMDFVPLFCLQCDDALCLQFCSVGAITKREDGIVVIDEERCTGCKQCMYACPYGLISFNETTKKAGKCNLCLSRTENGIEPSCVQHCIGGALRFVHPGELDALANGRHWVRMGRTHFISSKWRLHPPNLG